jgi:hypothetical protein
VQLISSQASERRVPHILRGHKATLEFTNTGFTVKAERPYASEVKEIEHKKTGAEELDLHHRNLINAIRVNDVLRCDVMLGYYGVVACAMGNESYRHRKYMKWDAAKERIVAS